MHYRAHENINTGFTVIELIIVVVVVGIIAIVAIPYFINLQKEARISALHGLKSAAEFSVIMVHDRAVIAGKDRLEESYDCYESRAEHFNCIDSAKIFAVYGRPKASEDGLLRAMHLNALKSSEIKNDSDTEKSDFFWVYEKPSERRIILYQPHAPVVRGISADSKGKLKASSGCGLIYQEPYMAETEKKDENGNVYVEKTLVDYRISVVDVDC